MTGSHPTTIGKYTVLSVLGRGGMGIVYKARDTIIDRIVAIKTISVTQEMKSEELRRRLQMEAQSAGRLQHPNIATLYDYGTYGDTPYIVMEYVEGTDLAQVIDQNLTLTLPQKIDILIQIGHGLAYAHELDVVHRDMKPSNIRLTSRCVAKIIDFGLARFDSTRLTRTGFMSGTIAYMSPERINGTEGASDDIFALGTIAYELLTGTRAFPGSTAPEVIMRIISQSPPPPSTVAPLPPELDAIVMKGVAREVSERYSSAVAIADALDEFRHTSLRDFLAKEPGGAEFDPRIRPSLVTTLQFPVQPDEADLPTAINARTDDTDDAVVASTVAETHVEPRHSEGVPTMVEPRPGAAPRPAFARWGSVTAVLAIAIVGGFLFLRPAPENQAGGSTTPLPAVQAPVGENTAVTTSPAAEGITGQRLLLNEMQNDLRSLRLGPDEQARLTRAQAQAAMAEEKYQQRDYATTADLLNSALRDMRDLRRDHYERLASQGAPLPSGGVATATQPPAAAAAPAKQRKTPVVASTPTRPAPAEPVPAPPSRPAEEPAPLTPPQPAVDPAVKARAEITQFIARLATAYERRDVAFFREHDANFNERLAGAIRNSPSVHVDMAIESIALQSPDRAEVKVVRTDRFDDRNIPVGVQRLTFTLARSGQGWRILEMTREPRR